MRWSIESRAGCLGNSETRSRFPPDSEWNGALCSQRRRDWYGPLCVDRGPQLAASYFAWAVADGRPDLSNGELHLPLTEDGLYRLEPSRVFSARTAVTMGDARDYSASGPGGIFAKLHAIWDMHLPNTLRARW